MAIVLGKLARVLIGTTPVVVGHLVGQINYEVTDTLVDVTAYDSTARTFASADIKQGALSFEAQFDAADPTQDALRAAAVAGQSALINVALYPEGASSGKVKFTGQMALESIKQVGAEMEGAVTMACSFKGAPLVEGLVA